MVLHPTRRKIGRFRDVSANQSLGLVWRKLNLTQQKQALTNQKKMYYNTKLTQKTQAFYNILPGNGAGLFSKEKISKGGDK